jgi:hypothetical protein
VNPRRRFKWPVAGLIAAAVFCTLVFRSSTREPTRQERIEAALRTLQRQITWQHKGSVALWKILPNALRRDFLAPANLVELKTEACRELAYLDADSPEVINAYKKALDDPRVQSAALKNLRALGPRASNALDRLILYQRQTNIADNAYEAYGTLAAIGPADERVLTALIEGLATTNENAFAALMTLRTHAAHYDERVQARILEAADQRPELLRMAVGIVGRIAPRSPKTCLLVLGFLRDERPEIRLRATEVAPESAAADGRIIKELIKLLGQSQDEPVIKALGRIGPDARDAIPLLRQSLSGPLNTSRNRSISIALWKIASETEALKQVFGATLAASNQTDRAQVLHLSSIARECPTAVELLSRALADPERQIRFRAVGALASLGERSRPHLAAIEELKTDPSPSIRDKAAEAAAKIRGSE